MPVTAVRTGVFAGRVQPSVPKLCVQSAHRYAFSNGVLTPVDHCGFLDLAPRLHRLPPARTPTAMLRQDLISTTHQPDPAPTGPPLRQDTSDGRMPSWKRGEVGVDSRFSEQSIPGGLYVTIGTLGRLACRRWTVGCANWWTRCRRLWPMRWSPAWGPAGLTIPSSPCLHEAIVQAINAITAALRVLPRACRSTTLPFRSPDHARGRYDTTIVPCAAGSDVVEVSGPDIAGTRVPRVPGR
jgi:hypothetical protein